MELEERNSNISNADGVMCNKCGSTNMRTQRDEIITFRDGKPYASVRAKAGELFHICNACRNVQVEAEKVEFRLLNRKERKRIESINKRRSKAARKAA